MKELEINTEAISKQTYQCDLLEQELEEAIDDLDTVDEMIREQEKNRNKGEILTFESYNDITTIYNFFIDKYKFDRKEIYTSKIVSVEDFNQYKPYMFSVSIESGNNLWNKLVEAIKTILIKIYNSIRMVYAKVLTYLPIIEDSINKLLGFIAANEVAPPKTIEKDQLRDIINKASALLKVNKDVRDIENLLNPTVRLKLVTSIGMPAITYGNAAINDLAIDNQDIANTARKVTDNILSTKYYTPFEKYNDVLPKLDFPKYNNLVFRADGRNVKYLTYFTKETENGIPIIGYNVGNYYVTYQEENTLLIGKVFTVNDVKLLLRTTLNYLSSSKNFQSEVSKLVKSIKNIGDKLTTGSKADVYGPVSGTKRLVVSNFYKLMKPILNGVTTDIVIGYLHTAKDVYNMSYKYANLWYDKKYSVSGESELDLLDYKRLSVEMYKGKGNTNKSHNEIFESPPSLYDIEANEELQKEHEAKMSKDALDEPVEDVLAVNDASDPENEPEDILAVENTTDALIKE